MTFGKANIPTDVYLSLIHISGTYHHSRNKETADYLHQVHIVLRQKEEPLEVAAQTDEPSRATSRSATSACESLMPSGTASCRTMRGSVPLGIRDSHADVALRDVALKGIQVLAAQTAEPVSYTHLDVYKRQRKS